MLHVLLEEELYDAAFAREWTNGAFLMRSDTQQLLTAQDLSPTGPPETFLVWDGRSGGPVDYHADRGYGQEGITPALSGTYPLTLADGHVVDCRPAFDLLKELAAQYAPERSEETTWVPAYDVYRAVLTGQPYPVKALVTFGTDLLLGRGDPLRGKAALEALDFYVHVDMFANPSAAFADLLLPACTCWEREALSPSFQTAEDTHTWVQLRPPVVQPLYESRSDPEILFDLARRLGLGEHFFDGDLEAAFNYQLAPSGLTVQQLREHPMGLRAEGQTHYRKYAEIDLQTGRPQGFQTPSRKVEIYATRFARAGYAPLPVLQEPVERPDSRPELAQEYPFVLTFNVRRRLCGAAPLGSSSRSP